MLDDFNNAQGPSDSPLPAGITEHMYMPTESLFGGVCNNVRAHGWTIIPQEREGRRLPSKIDGQTLKWGEYIDTMPTPAETRRWGLQARTANGAILLGPASGNVWALDIDVLDEELSYSIQEIATEILGRTEFRRQGQAPKMALFYRAADEGSLPAYRSLKFLENDGTTISENGIEMLGRGRLITCYGYHHRTSQYFRWSGMQPINRTPEDVPVATSEQLEAFIVAVSKLRSFASTGKSGAAQPMAGDSVLECVDGWVIPPDRVPVEMNGVLISGGREGWLAAFCFDLVRYNPERALSSVATAIEVAVKFASSRLDLKKTIGGTDLRSAVYDRIRRSVQMLRDGEMKSLPKVREIDGKATVNRRGAMQTAADPALWHLPESHKRKSIEFKSVIPADPVKAAERKLRTNRDHVDGIVVDGVHQALTEFFDDVYSCDLEDKKAVHVLKVPTGGGKTTSTIRYIASDPRSFDMGLVLPGDEPPAPLLFLLPTYNNIDEIRARINILNLDPSLSDEELARDAAELGVLSEEKAAEEIAKLRDEAKNAGLKTMVFKGKIPAGCQFPEQVQRLMDAGISTSGMCHAKVRALGGEEEDRYCPHYSNCEAILQKARIAESHVVFLPHAFLSLTIPSELQHVRAVVADERIFTLSVHSTQFPLNTLARPRAVPKLSTKEREAGISPHEYLQDRDQACDLATSALKVGQDVAAVLAAHPEGQRIVASSLRVCGAASSANVEIFPGMPAKRFDELVGRPASKDVKIEARFWRIVDGRIDRILAWNEIKASAVTQANIARLGPTNAKPRDHSNSIQLRYQGAEGGTTIPMIRLSWLTKPNWPAAPLLLLDASASEEIIGRVFPDREVVVHEIEVDLNLKAVLIADRRMSTSSLNPADGATTLERALAARNIETVRNVETALALGRHADGHLVTASPKSVRNASATAFLPPANVDRIHFGAERGLNFAEAHVAALIVGRLELPVWLLDGLAAALAGDDEELVLLDPHGNGCDADSKPLGPTMGDLTVPMRDGRDVKIETAIAPDGWQRIVQIQFREESGRQGIGRLRPVYREDTPIAYIMSQCLPEGIVVDDIVSASDLIPSYMPLLDAARSNGSVVDYKLAIRNRPDIAAPADFKAQFAALPVEMKDRYTVLRYTRDRAAKDSYFSAVPGFVEDPVAVLEAELQEAGMTIVGRPVIVRAPRIAPTKAAGARPLDTIEIALGDRPQRRADEDAACKAAMENITSRHVTTPTQPPFVLGAGRYLAAVESKGGNVMLGLSAFALLSEPKAKRAAVEINDVPDSAIAI